MYRLLSVALVLVAQCGDDHDKKWNPTWRGLEVGLPCEGDGECGPGVVEKKSDWVATCSSMPGGSAAQDKPEVCDDLDNDCSGVVDDLLGAPNADLQHGVCAAARKKCTAAGGWIEPDYGAMAGYQVDETLCDELDNDCDGTADEGCPDCDAMDARGLFPNCNSCPTNDCDHISAPLANGYACGCSAPCPCALSCGSITVAANVTVTACTR